MPNLFCTLDSQRIADLILSAKRFVCYAGPGIQKTPAIAMVKIAREIGSEMVSVALDFNERVMRMGFGDIDSVKILRDAGIIVRDAPGLRTALVLVDDEGFVFTPTALYLEAEPHGRHAVNAMRLSREQFGEALARISPVAKAIAIAQAPDEKERDRIANLPLEVGVEPVDENRVEIVGRELEEAPPVNFDVARQVRVYTAYIQYIELKLTGAAIQRRRLTIPPKILKIGGSEDLEGRLRTTFELIEKDGKLSSRSLEAELSEIRNIFTPSLGKNHGRVVLKHAKPRLEKRLRALSDKLDKHQQNVVRKLQSHLDESRKQIIDYYLPRVIDSPPAAMLGQMLHRKPTKGEASRWLGAELDRVFPSAETLARNMKLDVRYKDVTYETLNQPDFFQSVKDAFPSVNWERLYAEFLAAGEEETMG